MMTAAKKPVRLCRRGLAGRPAAYILSPKTLAGQQAEFKCRDWGKRSEMVPLAGLADMLQSRVQEELASFA